MSREIKFRVWGKTEKEYIRYPFAWLILFDSPDGLEIEENKDLVVEQYTGLTDKNGKEIYEGDIVEQFVCGIHQFKGKKCGRSTIWQVRWDKRECCFELHYLSGSLFGDSMMSDGDEYEVIGNIHENPELLI